MLFAEWIIFIIQHDNMHIMDGCISKYPIIELSYLHVFILNALAG
jgi:hypothetical protein